MGDMVIAPGGGRTLCSLEADLHAAASAMHDHVANSKKQLLKGLERVERPAGR